MHSLEALNTLINARKLPGPVDIVQERPMVKPVVIGGVALGMVSRCYRCRLVSIDSVLPARALAVFDVASQPSNASCQASGQQEQSHAKAGHDVE